MSTAAGPQGEVPAAPSGARQAGRTLVLMRHAAAEGWSPTGDMGRPLTPEGRTEAARAGALLRPLGIQRVLCSGAVRTRETVAHLGLDAPVEYHEALHNCSEATLMAHIARVGDEVTSLLVVGHAPAIPGLAAELAWAAGSPEAEEIAGWFPTATVCRFRLDGSWRTLAETDEVHVEGIHRLG